MISNKNEFNQNLFKNFNMGSNLEMNMQEWCLCNTPTCLYLSSSQQITATRDNSDKLISLNKEFCSCELLDERKYSASNDFQNLCLAYPTSYPISNINMGEIIDPVKSRKRSVGLPDIDENLLKILNLAYQNVNVSFQHCEKSARGLHNGVSHRRSAFVGVLRNRGRWQVLINEGKKKRYIGTYCTEIEAAIVNDFYSIGINCLKAKTNFYYPQELIISMIESYFNQGKVFNPSLFVSQVICEKM